MKLSLWYVAVGDGVGDTPTAVTDATWENNSYSYILNTNMIIKLNDNYVIVDTANQMIFISTTCNINLQIMSKFLHLIDIFDVLLALF